MSVVEARQMMDETTASMSDDEVIRLVNSLTLLAESFIGAAQNDSKYRVNIEYNRGDK